MTEPKYKIQRNKRTGEYRKVPILKDQDDPRLKDVNHEPDRFKTGSNQMEDVPQEGRFMSGVTGFNTAMKNLTQGVMQPFLKNTDVFKNAVNQREIDYAFSKAQNPGSVLAGEIIGNLAASLPFMGGGAAVAAKGGQLAKNVPYLGKAAQSPYVQGIAGNALGGAGMGGAEYVNEGDTRLGNAGKGAAIGGAFGAAAPAIGKGTALFGKYIAKPVWQATKDAAEYGLRSIGSEPAIIRDMLKRYSPQEISKALGMQAKAKELDIDLTPAEAAQNMIGGKYEGKLGTSPEGDRKLYEFKKGQKGQEKEAIGDLMNTIEPTGENASELVRDTAKKVISKKEQALQRKARPFYEASEHKVIPANTLNALTKDGNVNKAYQEVLNDAAYQSEIEGFKPNSIKVLDEVKKRLDGQIGLADRSGDKNLARIIRNSKEKLVKQLDKISPEYKKARAIYSQESPLIDLVRNRQVGKIAKLNDVDIKKVAGYIFDPSETDPKVLNRLRDEISKENPEAWKKIVRQAMKKKVQTAKSEHPGTNFYNKVLKDENTYDQFHNALKGNKEAQEKLGIMRHVFKDVINPRSVKGAEALSKSSLDVSRNTASNVKTFIANANGGKFDNAAIDIITSDKWKKAFFDKMMDLSKPEKERALAKAFEKATKGTAKHGTRAVAGATVAGNTSKHPLIKTPNYEIYEQE